MVNVNNEVEILFLEEKFKVYIYFEEGMDDFMFFFYLNMVKNYVKIVIGG